VRVSKLRRQLCTAPTDSNGLLHVAALVANIKNSKYLPDKKSMRG
jgi:hypothetical protein